MKTAELGRCGQLHFEYPVLGRSKKVSLLMRRIVLFALLILFHISFHFVQAQSNIGTCDATLEKRMRYDKWDPTLEVGDQQMFYCAYDGAAYSWFLMDFGTVSACTAADEGKVRYASNIYQYCDGNNWNTMKRSAISNAVVTGAGGVNCVAGLAGKQTFLTIAGIGTMIFCDGNSWYSMGATVVTFAFRNDTSANVKKGESWTIPTYETMRVRIYGAGGGGGGTSGNGFAGVVATWNHSGSCNGAETGEIIVNSGLGGAKAGTYTGGAGGSAGTGGDVNLAGTAGTAGNNASGGAGANAVRGGAKGGATITAEATGNKGGLPSAGAGGGFVAGGGGGGGGSGGYSEKTYVFAVNPVVSANADGKICLTLPKGGKYGAGAGGKIGGRGGAGRIQIIYW